MNTMRYTLGIDIGSTTVKIAILDEDHKLLFSDYKRHYTICSSRIISGITPISGKRCLHCCSSLSTLLGICMFIP